MKRKVIAFVFSLITFTSIAGSGDAILTCKSASGRTIFNARIQDLHDFSSGEFSIDNFKHVFSSNENSNVVFNSNHGVFTLFVQDNLDGKFRFIEFFAIPSSFKIVKHESDHRLYRFEAIIVGTEPRKGKGLRTPEITLNCTLEYKI